MTTSHQPREDPVPMQSTHTRCGGLTNGQIVAPSRLISVVLVVEGPLRIVAKENWGTMVLLIFLERFATLVFLI